MDVLFHQKKLLIMRKFILKVSNGPLSVAGPPEDKRTHTHIMCMRSGVGYL